MKDANDTNAADATMADAVRRIARWGLSAGGAALVVGLVATVSGWTGVARISLVTGLCVIVTLPVVNVVAALVEELRRREWLFIVTAIAVLAILLYNVARVFGVVPN